MYTGMREGDALKLRKNQCVDNVITFNTSKTGQVVHWPVISTLKSILKQAPHHNATTFSATTRGTPWTEGGFRTEWTKLRKQLELEGLVGKGLTIHGLRHTLANTLREQGQDMESIKDALGHASTAMTKHYTKDADIMKNMEAVKATLEASENIKVSSNSQ